MCKQNAAIVNFGSHAANYGKSKVHGDPLLLDRMICLLKPQPSDTAIDIATGGGFTALALARHTAHVTAIDITQEMLQEAEKAAAEQEVANITFLKNDVHDLSFAEASFDIAACRFAAHHFVDLERAMRQIHRVLKPGGRLYILDCSVAGSTEDQVFINSIERLRDSSHVNSRSGREWRDLLEKLRFNVESAEVKMWTYELPWWFDQIGTPEPQREKIFARLAQMPVSTRSWYSYSETHLDTYKVEILATRL